MQSTTKAMTSKTTTSKAAGHSSAAKSGTAAKSPDAIALLKADHAEVKKCFQAYEKLATAEADGDERQAMAEKICSLLTVHATIEEEIFYPAAREALGEDANLVDEADVEHAGAKDLIAQIEAMSPDDDHFDAKLKVLGEYIDHHVKEEQDEMFPKCREADMDLKGLGVELAARKEELVSEMAGSLQAR